MDEVAIAERGLENVRQSPWLDPRELHHLRPFLGFVSDELAEFGGRAGKHFAAKLGKPRVHLGVGESGIDFLVELVDDLGGGIPGRADAVPGARLISWDEIA